MTLFNYLIWSQNPEIFTIPLSSFGMPDRPIVWYGLLFALGFIISQQVLYKIYSKENLPPSDVDTLTTYMVLATIIGARLGHCLFYNPGYYLSNPIEIIKIWEGGLASHGAGIGIFVAIWIYVNYEIKSKWFIIIPIKFKAKKRKKEGQSYLSVLDKLAIVVALTGALIRTGNFFNSEMEGIETNSNIGVVYAKGTKDVLKFNEEQVESVTFRKREDNNNGTPGRVPITAVVTLNSNVQIDQSMEQFVLTRLGRALKTYPEVIEHIDFGRIDEQLNYAIVREGKTTQLEIYGIGIVRHTSQLYEAGACIIIMLILLWIWQNKRNQVPTGFIFALFMMLLWSQRFIGEFFKMDQESFEADMVINMGQILSIPMFLAGVILMFTIYRKK